MKFRKKPVVIEAMQFIDPGLYPEIAKFTERKAKMQMSDCGEFRLVIPTLEGDIFATKGDWIIRGIKGEFYPCKPDIFEASYEAVTP